MVVKYFSIPSDVGREEVSGNSLRRLILMENAGYFFSMVFIMLDIPLSCWPGAMSGSPSCVNLLCANLYRLRVDSTSVTVLATGGFLRKLSKVWVSSGPAGCSLESTLTNNITDEMRPSPARSTTGTFTESGNTLSIAEVSLASKSRSSLLTAGA